MLPYEPKDLSEVKIIDFGLARDSSVAPKKVAYGNLPYRAPEIILQLPFGHPIDMWALGCMAFVLYTGEKLVIKPKDEFDAVSNSIYFISCVC